MSLEIISPTIHAVLANQEATYREMLDVFDLAVITRAMEMCGNNQVKQLRLLRINRNTLRRKLKAAGLHNLNRNSSHG
jgi:DNA-binding protein Fis